MANWLGIDVGGANLKLADSHGFAASFPFELWNRRDELAETLRTLLSGAPKWDAVAATMTGELADCYETKHEGVRHITESLREALGQSPLAVYCVDGEFRAADQVLTEPSLAAASNWHALARLASRHLPARTGIVLDIGSTTTDIIPVVDGKVLTTSKTDTDRLLAGELVYTGVRRTPVCALARVLPYRGELCPVAAEFFATTVDVYRVLGDIVELEGTTADGRSLSEGHAIDRLARQVCADRMSFTHADAMAACEYLESQQVELIRAAIAKVQSRSSVPLEHVVVSGSGEWLAARVAKLVFGEHEVMSLSQQISAAASDAAAAVAVATLASELP
ncbi:hydantoinase/oxoprolinase family protein [Aeoliella sp. SH292]|uniref:hydantoinase/oxoprolinase family protein n=1 Tax=Aeoliella sp. SH292 TaxID=3454464 RepID=UPI003F94D4BF